MSTETANKIKVDLENLRHISDVASASKVIARQIQSEWRGTKRIKMYFEDDVLVIAPDDGPLWRPRIQFLEDTDVLKRACVKTLHFLIEDILEVGK